MSLRYPAPAKLNLFLHVTGRRADGYHLLQSVFRFLDHADVVELRLREDGVIRRLNPLPGVAEADDLTVRAACLLKPYAPPGMGVEIGLEKNLPMGGGLGGGSSDAATVLLALNHHWGVHLPRKALMALALELGADVPVFVFGRTAFAEGVGEILSPVDIAPAWYVVLVPPVSVSTATVFADPELTRDSPPIKIADFAAGTVGRNDLEPVVCRRHPEVACHLQWLARWGEARMTGSGACVFAAFATRDEAESVLEALPQTMQGFVAQGVDVHPLHALCAD